MKLIKDIQFYEECQNTLLEAYGSTDLAVRIISEKKNSTYSDYDIRRTIESINEGWGDKIVNFLSKHLGGDVSKIDTVVANIKGEEIDFITKEHELEKNFINHHSSLLQLRSQKAPKDQIERTIFTIKKCEKGLRDLISSHKGIMDDFEKQIDILTKNNSRKTEYYNYKRAKDSAETKKKRAEMKLSMVSTSNDDEILKELKKTFGSSDEAQKEYNNAKSDLEEQESKLINKQGNKAYTRYTVSQLMEMYKSENMKSLKGLKDEINKAISAISYYKGRSLMDDRLYNQGSENAKGKFIGLVEFNDKKKEILNAITNQINILSKTDVSNEIDKRFRSIFTKDLKAIKVKIDNMEYPSWKSKDTDYSMDKKYIEDLMSYISNISTNN